ncbi:hypothetical protein TELCIR_11818, partial [Teladorsagia circumcincta]
MQASYSSASFNGASRKVNWPACQYTGQQFQPWNNGLLDVCPVGQPGLGEDRVVGGVTFAVPGANPNKVWDGLLAKPPDPWDKSIVRFMDVKYGFLKDCIPNKTLSPVTELKKGKVLLKEGQKDFVCRASCIEYAGDNKHTMTKWTQITNVTFNCDFVEMDCKSSNMTKRYIHMQVAEQKNTTKLPVNPKIHPDVVVMVIDSVASTQTISIGKTTEAVTRKAMNLPTIPADLSYDQYCRRYLDNESYIPLMYQKAGYKSRLSSDRHLEYVHMKGSCRLPHDNMLDYLEHFVNAYEGLPKFSLTWFVWMAHDDTLSLYVADYKLYDFYLKNRDALNNSFIFFFGDHGPRHGN